MKYIEFRKWNAAGTSATLLPSWTNATVSDVFNDAGMVNFEYPLEDFQDAAGRTFSGARTLGLSDGVEVGVVIDGVEQLRMVIEDTSTTNADDGALRRTCEGRTLLGYLEDAIVYPSAFPSGTPAGHSFSNANPGTILQTLLIRAQARGTATSVNLGSFTGTTDSAGHGWTKTQTITYDTGYTVLQVVQDLVTAGLCEVDMVGRTLMVYNQGTLTVTRPTRVRRAYNITEASETTDAKDLGNATLIEGDNGVVVEVHDAAAITAFGRRRERYVNQGGMTDVGTLTLIGTANNDLSKADMMQVTLGVSANDLLLDSLPANTIGNPGFEVDTALWSASNATLTRGTAFHDTGVASGHVVTSNTSQANVLPFSAAGTLPNSRGRILEDRFGSSQPLQAAATVKATTTCRVACRFNIYTWSDATQSFSASVETQPLTTNFVDLAAGQTARVASTYTPVNQAGTHYLPTFYVYTNGTASPAPTGTTFDIDSVCANAIPGPSTAYLDGSSPGYAWAGAANASPTYKVIEYADPQPWVDYKPGEWITVDRGQGNEQLQVQQIALGVDETRTLTLGLTVGTLLDAADVKLQRKLDAIIGGNSGISGPLPTNLLDFIAPGAPSTANASTTGYVSLTGTPYAQVTLSWTPVSTNSDGTACTDLDHYEVNTKTTGNPWVPGGNVPAGNNTAYFSGLPPGATWTAQVRAVDTDGNASPYRLLTGVPSSGATIVLAGVVSIPNTPSTPTVSNSVGSLYVGWDGKDNGAVLYLTSALRWIEIHISTTNGFTPSATSFQGTATGATLLRVQPITYGTTYYVKFVAVDFSGNKSPASIQAQVTPAAILTGEIANGQIQAPNIAPNAVTATAIASGSISTPKLAANSVTAAQIAANTITSAQILAGSITANSIAAGTITSDKIAADAISGKTITGGTISLGGGTFAVDINGRATMNSGVITSGQLVAPDPAVGTPAGWLQLTNNDLRVWNAATMNFCVNGSMEVSQGVMFPDPGTSTGGNPDSTTAIFNNTLSSTAVAATSAFINGVPTADIYGNVDNSSKFSNRAYQVIPPSGGINASKGFTQSAPVTAPGGNAFFVPSGATYTVSTYIALGSQTYGNLYSIGVNCPVLCLDNFGIVGAVRGAKVTGNYPYHAVAGGPISTGIDGFDVVDPRAAPSSTTPANAVVPSLGRHLPSDPDWTQFVVSVGGKSYLKLLQGPWVIRLFKTFTVPAGYESSGVGTGTDLFVRLAVNLPAPDLITPGAVINNEPFASVYYDGVQIEPGAKVTAFCDGNQAYGDWSGAANKSTSTRPLPVPSFAVSYSGDASLTGVLQASDVTATGTIKRGSGAPFGTNFVTALATVSQTSGDGLLHGIKFDSFGSARLSQDDGTIFTNNDPVQGPGVTVFYANQPGLYAFSTTISFETSTLPNSGPRLVRWRKVTGSIVAEQLLNGSLFNVTNQTCVMTCSTLYWSGGNGEGFFVEVMQGSGATCTYFPSAPTSPMNASFGQVL